MNKIERLQNRLKTHNTWLDETDAARYLELVGKYRTEEEEAEKTQLLKLAANTEPPEEKESEG